MTGLLPGALVLTVSDGVIAGTRPDKSGPVLAELLEAAGFQVGRDGAGGSRRAAPPPPRRHDGRHGDDAARRHAAGAAAVARLRGARLRRAHAPRGPPLDALRVALALARRGHRPLPRAGRARQPGRRPRIAPGRPAGARPPPGGRGPTTPPARGGGRRPGGGAGAGPPAPGAGPPLPARPPRLRRPRAVFRAGDGAPPA